MAKKEERAALINPASDPELEKNVARFMKLVNKARDLGELDIFAGLFQPDFRIMGYLKEHANAHPSEMAEALKESRPNIAANLRLLEEKGYITRELDEENRRQVYVNVTEEGLAFLNRCETQMTFLFAGWFGLLGKEETEHLFKILEISTSPEVMNEELKSFHVGD